MRLRRGSTGRKHEITIASAIATFWCMTVEPGGAPMMRPTWSPTVSGSSHHPSAHARMPRSRHARANSSTRSSAAAGIAPSEWLIRYVVCSRIGNRSRYEVRDMSRGLSPGLVRCGQFPLARADVSGRRSEEPSRQDLLLLEDVSRPAADTRAGKHRRDELRRDLRDVEHQRGV